MFTVYLSRGPIADGSVLDPIDRSGYETALTTASSLATSYPNKEVQVQDSYGFVVAVFRDGIRVGMKPIY